MSEKCCHAGHEGANQAEEMEKDIAWEEAWEHPFLINYYDWLENVEPETFIRLFGGDEDEKTLVCIDERPEADKGGLVYLAGSGVLYKEIEDIEDEEERLLVLSEALRGKGITGVSSHRDCGAVKRYCEAKGISDPDKYAREWSQNLARELGVPYAGHLPVSRSFHDACIAYYDGTGKLRDPVACGLPPGFKISRGFFPDKDNAIFEVGLAVQIALGSHGFGKRFSLARPFHIVILHDPSNRDLTEKVLLAEANQAIGGNPLVKTVTLSVAL